MRLYLSSEGFGNQPNRLVELVGKNRKVAFIDNAKDDLWPSDRAAHVGEKADEFESLGFDFDEIDLRDYFDRSEDLANDILKYGLVWASGGNTFILRRAMKYSGLDKILINLVKQDKLAYGGSSAGSIIPTPGLYGAEFGDEFDSIPEGYEPEVIWNGLNLVPFHIIPHYGSDWFGKEAEAMVNVLTKKRHPHKKLSDGQVIVIDGDKEELLR